MRPEEFLVLPGSVPLDTVHKDAQRTPIGFSHTRNRTKMYVSRNCFPPLPSICRRESPHGPVVLQADKNQVHTDGTSNTVTNYVVMEMLPVMPPHECSRRIRNGSCG